MTRPHRQDRLRSRLPRRRPKPRWPTISCGATSHHATDVIRGKRALRVEEMPDWQQLRDAGSAIKAHTLAHLDHYLAEFERNCERAGGNVHWARDADEANAIAIDLIRQHGGKEVIKVKTMTSDEVQMNPALEAAGITPYRDRSGRHDRADGPRRALAHRRPRAAPKSH